MSRQNLKQNAKIKLLWHKKTSKLTIVGLMTDLGLTIHFFANINLQTIILIINFATIWAISWSWAIAWRHKECVFALSTSRNFGKNFFHRWISSNKAPSRAYTNPPHRREQYNGMAWGILFISVEGMPKASWRITRQVSTLSFYNNH